MPKLPVFISRPSRRNPEQEDCYLFMIKQLRAMDLDDRTIEAAEYPFDYPLREVRALAERCAGGLVLGFAHARLAPAEDTDIAPDGEPIDRWSPTPWNNLEAGILYGLRLPLLIFRDRSVAGGIFDPTATGEHVHVMPDADDRVKHRAQLTKVFRHWRDRVEAKYFEPR